MSYLPALISADQQWCGPNATALAVSPANSRNNCVCHCSTTATACQPHFATALQAVVNNIVDGLFSVLVTLGVVPIIRCPKGGAAEHVAAALEGRLRDHLKARSNLFSEGATALSATLSRPLLVIFDRNFDLSVMLQHCWSYKPLVQVRGGLGAGYCCSSWQLAVGSSVGGQARGTAGHISHWCR